MELDNENLNLLRSWRAAYKMRENVGFSGMKYIEIDESGRSVWRNLIYIYVLKERTILPIEIQAQGKQPDPYMIVSFRIL